MERYEVFGDDSYAHIDAGVRVWIDRPGSIEVTRANKVVRIKDPLAPYRSFSGQLRAAAYGGWYGANATFVAALASGGPMAPAVDECLESVVIAEAIQAGKNWRRR
jgi:hypothetical protein